MTTIKLKNGSGAPTAGDLAQGEPALDLTNKRLYTEDSGGTVIEVGTNPGTDVTFADNRKAVFGAGSDLQIYHDGSHSYVSDQGTGRLVLNSSGGGVRIEKSPTENMAIFTPDGNCELFYDNSLKLATTSTGIDVTGTVTADGLTVTGSDAALVASIGTDAQRVYITPDGTEINYNASGNSAGSHMFQTGNVNRLNITSNGDISFYEDTGTTAKFFWDASAESLGIGTTSPATDLHIKNAGATQLLLESGNTDTGFLLFGDAEDSNIGSVSYDHSDNSMRFETDDSERMRINSSGNVKIGTNTDRFSYLTATTANLQIDGGVVFEPGSGNNVELFNYRSTDMLFGNGGAEAMRIDSSGNIQQGTFSDTSVKSLQLRTNKALLTFEADGATNANGSVINYSWANGGQGPLKFKNAASTVMTLDASGNLLVGTADANSRKFRVSGSGDLVEFVSTNAGAGGAQIDLKHESASPANGDSVGIINFTGYDSGSNDTQYANITGKAGSVSSEQGELHFGTRESSSTYTHSQMVLDSSGNLLHGITGVPTGVLLGKQLVSSSPTGSEIIAFREDSSVAVGDKAGAFLIGNSDTDGAEDHFVGMWGKVSSTNGSQNLHFAAGRSGYEGDTPQMTLDNSGNLLVGTTTTSRTIAGHELHASGFARHTASNDKTLEIVRTNGDGEMVEFFRDTSLVGTIGAYSGDLTIGNGNTVGLIFEQTGSDRISPWNLTANATRDGEIDLGDSNQRFKDIYASNGTIQTSDRNEKQDIEELSDAEQRVAVAAKGLLRKFRWIDSVEEKGDEARIHFGIIAQDLQDAFIAEGLDAGRYAMFINSTWTDEETGEERSRMGVRYSELLAFIISAI